MKSLHKLFLICLSLAIVGVSSLDAHASIQPYGYAVQSDGDDHLYRIDLVTGDVTVVGSGTGYGSIEGLTWDIETEHFFGADSNRDKLIKINPSTGLGQEVGDFDISGAFRAPGMAISDTGVIYMTSEKDDTPLYSVNKLTGKATLIGLTGIEDITGLAFLDGTLYGVSDEDDALFSIDTGTGVATIVGSGFGFNVDSELGAAGIPNDGVSGAGFIYAVTDVGDILKIDSTTGTAILYEDLTIDGFDDLAYGPPIPEPSSLAIFSMTAFGMVFLAMRRRRRENHSA